MTSPLLENFKILVIDESEEYAHLSRLHLERYSAKIATSATLSAAAHATKQTSFDLVLVELLMQNLSFLEVARAVVAMAPGCPVVAFTVLGSHVSHSYLSEAGVSRTFNKPTDFDSLAASIRQIIDDHKAS